MSITRPMPLRYQRKMPSEPSDTSLGEDTSPPVPPIPSPPALPAPALRYDPWQSSGPVGLTIITPAEGGARYRLAATPQIRQAHATTHGFGFGGSHAPSPRSYGAQPGMQAALPAGAGQPVPPALTGSYAYNPNLLPQIVAFLQQMERGAPYAQPLQVMGVAPGAFNPGYAGLSYAQTVGPWANQMFSSVPVGNGWSIPTMCR